ncbi:MAG TPA: HprK-related kinase A [Alphaproteobacteria bacterium]|nr:HprK-related kinase A [Alphaproteobacteria bacterium]
MIFGGLSPEEAGRRLAQGGVRLKVGPFAVSVQGDCGVFGRTFHFLYGDFPLLDAAEPAEFRIGLRRPLGLRRWLRPQVFFYLDDTQPFEPFPASLAMPLFEWGFNWCIYEHVHEFMLMHASVVERNGRALIMAAPPGSGKSTLCAALVHSGWRLLSDEFAIIDKGDGRLLPIPRPIGLKEESIELIRALAPAARFGPVFADTRKGKVAHLRPPADAVARVADPAIPAWLVFPAYAAGAGNRLVPVSKAQAFIRASENCFNYKPLGAAGFESLAALIDRCDGFELDFGDLEAALAALDGLAAARPELARAATGR